MKNNYLLIGLCLGFFFLCGNVKGQEWDSLRVIKSDSSYYYYYVYNVDISENYAIIAGLKDSLNEPPYNYPKSFGIYKKENENWVFQTEIIYPNPQPNEFFISYPISITDNYATIGVPNKIVNGIQSGAVFLYKREGENWIYDTLLTVNSDNLDKSFGCSVDLFEDYLIVGAVNYFSNDKGKGAVYIFKKEGNDWVKKVRLSDSTVYRFGESVSISNNYAVVGAISDSLQGTFSPNTGNSAIHRGQGFAFVYKNNNDNWNFDAKLSGSLAAESGWFGYKVATTEDNIIVSEPYGGVAPSGYRLYTGMGYFYKKIGSNWQEMAVIDGTTFVDRDQDGYVINNLHGAYLGRSLAMNNKYLILPTSKHRHFIFQILSDSLKLVQEFRYNREFKYLNQIITDVSVSNNHLILNTISHGNRMNVYISEKIPKNRISGKVYNDKNQNCEQNSGEKGLSNTIMVANPGPYYAAVDSLGNYTLEVGIGTYNIEQISTDNVALQRNSICPNNPDYYTVTFEEDEQDTTGFDFANTITECSLLKVDVSSNRRRRCFTNQTTVSYCNEGLVAAENVEIKVAFPQYVLPLSSTQAWTSQADSVYTFTIGTLAPGQCGNFTITDSVACVSGITGAAQCTQASIFPKNNCVQPNEDWNGAALAITGECLILFDPVALVSIKNTGTANMTTASQFRIFSSDTLVYQDQLQLVAGDSLVFEIPTQGQTVRIEVDQVPNYPGGTMISYQTSGDCGSPNTPNAALASLAMQFPTDDEPAEVESECLPIIDSYDPNDKQVHPIGFTENHYVRPGTELEYTIRFQNTGTAEAVNIVVIDTLSADLDMSQFQMMSASHTYKLQVSGKGRPILSWIFNNINLPDSTSNEPASHGFIKFKIKPLATIPEGTIIENFGDIYFDFNEPIRTNTTVSNITNYQFPTALIDFCTMVRKAEAGTNQTLCQTTTTLSGNTPTFGQGTWSVVSGAGTFTDANSPTSQVNNLAVGDNIFKWRISSSECTATESTVKITRLPFPTQANAGTEKTICEANNTLQGNTPSIGQGKWTLVSGSATISNVNASNSAIQNLAYGENTFRWSIGNGTCDSTHSTVKITRLREPTTANAGQDKSICESNYTLQGNTPQYG